jgi:hypothetical protein
MPKFTHVWVPAHSASSSNVPCQRFWMPYAIQSRGIIWRDLVFHQRIVLKYDIYSKKRLDVLEGLEMYKTCLCSSTWMCRSIWMHTQGTHLHINRPLNSFQDQTPCIFNHPNLGELARCFPTRPIWNLGFFQPSIMIMKNYNFHDLCWYFKVFRSRFEHFKVQKTFHGVI